MSGAYPTAVPAESLTVVVHIVKLGQLEKRKAEFGFHGWQVLGCLQKIILDNENGYSAAGDPVVAIGEARLTEYRAALLKAGGCVKDSLEWLVILALIRASLDILDALLD